MVNPAGNKTPVREGEVNASELATTTRTTRRVHAQQNAQARPREGPAHKNTIRPVPKVNSAAICSGRFIAGLRGIATHE